MGPASERKGNRFLTKERQDRGFGVGGYEGVSIPPQMAPVKFIGAIFFARQQRKPAAKSNALCCLALHGAEKPAGASSSTRKRERGPQTFGLSVSLGIMLSNIDRMP